MSPTLATWLIVIAAAGLGSIAFVVLAMCAAASMGPSRDETETTETNEATR